MFSQKKMLTNPCFISSELETETATSFIQPQQQQQFNVGRGFHKKRGSYIGSSSNRGRGGQRSQKHAGENDPYDMTIAPLNIYEN